ncbi:DUF938 domain-containing protein [Aphanothece hegewaldii]|nr:DUF938 domain-containing protein [Aphanothece hegewaldii]
MTDAKQYAPATERNREPILEVLLRVLPPTGNILEISSGTGEHAIFFAPRLKPRIWIPSDPQLYLRESITAWREEFPSDYLAAPLAIDTTDEHWSVEKQNVNIVAIVNINMIHIAPWSACLGLMAGAKRILPPRGILYLYGPYKQSGKHTAPSNEAFDESLQARDPAWGVRNLEDVVNVAKKQNLQLLEVIQMPANNISVVFERF